MPTILLTVCFLLLLGYQSGQKHANTEEIKTILVKRNKVVKIPEGETDVLSYLKIQFSTFEIENGEVSVMLQPRVWGIHM